MTITSDLEIPFVSVETALPAREKIKARILAFRENNIQEVNSNKIQIHEILHK